MYLAADIIVLAILLLLAQECFRRCGSRLVTVVFLALPLLLTPFWIQGDATVLLRELGNPVLFPWIKLYSLCFCACWIAALRFTALGDRPWALFATSLLLAVNILEAVVQDLVARDLIHCLNAASGMLLMFTIPYRCGAVAIDRGGGFRDLRFNGMTRGWIVGYTLWNWAFIYLNYQMTAGQHVAVFASSFVVGMIKPQRWLQARAYTLATWYLLIFTFPSFLVHRMDTSSWGTRGGSLGVFVAACHMVTYTLLVHRARASSAHAHLLQTAVGRRHYCGE